MWKANVLGDNIDYSIRRMFIDESRHSQYQNEQIKLDMTSFKKNVVAQINKFCYENNGGQRILSALERWQDILDNPAAGVVTSIQSLEKIFREFYKTSKLKWIWTINPDGNYVPYAIVNLELKGRNSEEESRLILTLQRGKLTQKEENSYWGTSAQLTQYFYKSDFEDVKDLFDEALENDLSSDDDDEDEENQKPKRKKRAKKSEPESLHQILAKKNLYLNSEKLVEKYTESRDVYYEYLNLVGTQFISEASVGITMEKRWGDSWYPRWVPLSDDDGKFKLICDSTAEDSKGRVATVSSKIYGDILMPMHQYLRCYDITKHRSAFVHVMSLKKYEYNRKIIDKLILSAQDKFILNGIIDSSKDDLSADIVAGKSGGLIVLASGPAGVGKTLTGEVYSEYMQRPLYSIQSAQLGLKIEDIENNLREVLHRAEKWGAFLLIDEADCYVHERGQDMEQNAIVGTFLRLLEYFNSMLFLTTNRGDIIDSAILSRVVAHIRYHYPLQEEQKQIWELLAQNYEIHLGPDLLDYVPRDYELSGRDIRNLLKLCKRLFPNEELTMEHIDKVKPYNECFQRRRNK